jgi:L-2-hydroxyglutarate oxidase LhgO
LLDYGWNQGKLLFKTEEKVDLSLTNTAEQLDIVIVGVGVVGLAVAAELSSRYDDAMIALVEKHDSFGLETSSRNSEVIHAGIYYPTGSLKAKLCVEGKELLYDFCRKYSIPHRQIGKLIVANSAEEKNSLESLQQQAIANGVLDIQEVEQTEISQLEPQIKARWALHSPSTGIINAHALMNRLEQIALQNGMLIAYCHSLQSIEKTNDGYRLQLTNPDFSTDEIETACLINCAGLDADQVASMAGIDVVQAGYQLHPCKGEYFSLPPAKANLINHLVYPPPLAELTGLGIHATKTLDGRLRLGPNALYTSQPDDYQVDPAHAAEFYDAVSSFLPFVNIEDLEPEMAGIRPKLSGPGEPFRDFIIREESERGLPGFINLIGIESPGLTACLSIARLVTSLF